MAEYVWRYTYFLDSNSAGRGRKRDVEERGTRRKEGQGGRRNEEEGGMRRKEG